MKQVLNEKCKELKEKFENIARENIKRDGLENVLSYLEETDFYSSPASARFHCSYEGGLVEHSINVYNELVGTMSKASYEYDNETIAIVSLFHDICKANTYQVQMRNTKNEYGQWVKVPYYMVEEEFPMGHGEKSVYLLMKNGLNLTDEEALAIRYHMGGFTENVNSSSVSNAFNKSMLAVELSVADVRATFIDEKVK